MKSVLLTGSECYPFVKTGGLADVMSALPKALVKDGWDARVMIPLYACIPEKYRSQMEFVNEFWMDMGQDERWYYVGIKKLEMDGVIYYFIDNEDLFSWGNPYSEMSNDLEKFIFFDKAVLAALPVIGWIPDILHCNDWQAGLIPVYLRTLFKDTEVGQKCRTIMTIHNLRFQGIQNIGRIKYLSGLPDYCFEPDQLSDHIDANMLKGGIVYADRVTTVSKSYAQEILTPEYGEGLDPVLDYHSYKVSGIVNGIDNDNYDPSRDQKIFTNYNVKTVLKGKKANKLALQKELGLEENPDKIMLGLISRLTDQKGLDLLEPIMENLIDGNTQFVLLGTGNAEYENAFRWFENNWKGTVSSSIMYSDERSRKIYAAADCILVPSRFEPCGLTQLMAMRYGAVPIVRETGGLRDTVEAYNDYTHEGTGFSFYDYRPEVLLDTINHAKTIYFTERDQWNELVKRDMRQDHSWTKAAKEYEALYDSL